jgi:carboxymethylenebutenolidase
MAGQMIEFQSNGGTTNGYLSLPESGRGPGVVVLQEWWGLVPHIRDVADRFAAAGFVALAPDLYHGDVARSPDEAGKMMMALNISQTEQDLRGAVEYLLNHEATTGDAVGTVGFCMGGALSLYAASKNARVLGLFAEKDTSVPPEAVRALEEKLRAHGKSVETHIYPGTDHAFFNDTRPEVYHAEAAADAWRRTIEFFRTHLGK